VSETPPGFYPGEGDPAGTVRYWDGTRWTSEPMPPPPGYIGPGKVSDSRYALVWVRIGATLLDGVISMILLLPVLIPWFSDILEQVDAGVPADEVTTEVPASLVVGGFIIMVAWALLAGLAGGTPGKLMLGLRITREDGTTTPPGVGRGFLRMVPGLIGSIPLIGVVLSMVVVVLSVVWVNTDPERRSPYDRVAGTRVVYRDRL
jgi:uncharacterized RDD family membrane protein YckC